MLQVSTLGYALIAAGQLRVTPSSARTFATLLYLASEPGRRFSRASLQAMIFPNFSESNGSHSLRQLVYKLRHSGAPIESKGANVWVGADQVRRDYAEVIASDRLTAEQLTSIEGGFLPGYVPEQNGGFAEWLESYRTRTTLEIRRAVLRELARARRVGDWKTVERAARACLALDPLNEEATLALAESIALAGSKAAAVRLLDDYLKEIGTASPDLRVPATVLRRRINERIPDSRYRSQPDLPFVGRSAEMALLADKFQLARRGQSQCVVISGDPGIGKTRLAAEFANVAMLDGARVERSAAQPHDIHRPLGAFVELVPRLLQLPGALGCSPESMVALKRLTTHDPNERGDPMELAVAPESVFYRITRAINDLVDSISVEATLALIVEDTHWLDPLSVRLIGELVSARKQRRLFVVLTSRDPTPLLESTRHADRVAGIVLGAISPEAATSLIATAIGEDAALTSWMVAASSGNPLFIAELTMHYLTTGERFSVPPTLRSVLARRLSTIDARTFAILQMCAVLGKCCTVSRLAIALDMPQIDLLQAVQEAEKARLVVTHGARVSIAHALVGDTVIELSAELALRLAHLRAAWTLDAEENTVPSAIELWELAEHWVGASNNDRALAAFRDCAQHALEIGRPREAAIALSRALTLPCPDQLRATIGRDMLLAASVCGEYPLAKRGLDAWRSVAKEVTHDAAELAELRTRAILADDIESTFDRLQTCVGSLRAPASHRMAAATSALKIAHHQAKPAWAERVLLLIRDLFTEPNTDIHTLEFSLIYHASLGNLSTARQCASRITEITQDWTPSTAAALQMNAALGFWMAGDANEAVASLQTAYRNAELSGLVRTRLMSALYLVFFYLDIDEGSDRNARCWFECAERNARDWPDHPCDIDFAMGRVQLALCAGDIPGAKRHLETMTSLPVRHSTDARWIEILKYWVRQLSGDAPLRGLDVEPLIAEAISLPRLELADLEIAVAAQAIIARGDAARGKQLIENYLSGWRRRRAPIDVHLANFARRLGITAYVIPQDSS